MAVTSSVKCDVLGFPSLMQIMDDYGRIVENLRKSFLAGKTRPLEWRLTQLKNLYRMLEERERELCDAVFKDLKKNPRETYAFELAHIKNDLALFIKNLSRYTAPEKVTGTGLINILDHCEIHRQPFGVALVIGAWNYPLLLLLQPAVAAIAAGNCVFMKPSEIATETEKALETILPSYCDPDCIKLVTGGPKETTQILKQKFDYIFYTGNPVVGKIIMRHAAETLTPLTLELGGKSPCIVDQDVDVDVVAKRIAWAKFVNAGQTCVAPDYVLVHKDIKDALIGALEKAISKIHSEDPQKSSTYGRIINQRHFERLCEFLKPQLAGKVIGGEKDPSTLYLAPTIISFDDLDAGGQTPVMTSEIFGPILPVLPIENIGEATLFVNSRESPLVLYIFSRNREVYTNILKHTSSGNAMVNDLLMAMAVNSLPFGGVGQSGLGGGYHGHHGFELFSHKRSVMYRPSGLEFTLAVRYPPFSYSDSGFSILKKLVDSFRPRL